MPSVAIGANSMAQRGTGYFKFVGSGTLWSEIATDCRFRMNISLGENERGYGEIRGAFGEKVHKVQIRW